MLVVSHQRVVLIHCGGHGYYNIASSAVARRVSFDTTITVILELLKQSTPPPEKA